MVFGFTFPICEVSPVHGALEKYKVVIRSDGEWVYS